ncbi:MAG: phosphate ABC transporter permease PstA [Chloroflexi bacterium]|nr:phosphate ABC transporter permease PstA [Chloroflexota bacterium]
MKPSTNYRWRKLVDRVMRGATVAATGCAVIPLVAIIAYVIALGGSAMSVSFFTDVYQPPDLPTQNDELINEEVPFNPDDPFANLEMPAPESTDGALAGESAESQAVANAYAAGPRGGVLHGILGTLMITGIGLLMALPIGIFAGVYLSEYRNERLATIVRFSSDVLSGSPSIVAGVVIYVLVVLQTEQFTAIAGSMALAILMVPIVTRTTEEMLKLVPEAMREAARGLGAPTWYSTFTVVLPTALPGIVTGVMLAFARGAGETAPLILTVLGSNVITMSMFEPMAALPLLTYRYTESPYIGENTLAWGAAFVLVVLVLIVNILVRLATRRVGVTR